MTSTIAWSLASFLVGSLLTALALQKAPRLLQTHRFSKKESRRFARDIPELFRFDFTTIGQFQLGSWSVKHPIHDVELAIAVPPRQSWCDDKTLEAKRRAVERDGGPTWFLSDFEVDDRESPTSEHFRMTLSPANYGDYQALRHLLREDRDLAHELFDRAQKHNGLRSQVRGSPKTAFGVQVNVVSGEHTMLAMRRSMTVGEHQGLWMLGCGETISESDVFDRVASLGKFSLIPICERALREEVGLEPEDYGPVHISWLGLNLQLGSNLLIAHVFSKLSERQIDCRIAECSSANEMTEVRWCSMRSGRLADLWNEMRLSDSEGELPHNAISRRWVPGQALVMHELIRLYPALVNLD